MRYDRFWAKVNRTAGDGCWEWNSHLNRTGYGQYFHEGRAVLAHRYAYEDAVGPIPAGMVIDHLCRNHSCVRPDHLEAVTQQTNLLRGNTKASQNANKTHCPHGHEYTPENTYTPPSGSRMCRTCRHTRKQQARTKANRLVP